MSESNWQRGAGLDQGRKRHCLVEYGAPKNNSFAGAISAGVRMIRAVWTASSELDDTLVSLQSGGAVICQVLACPERFLFDAEELGLGKTRTISKVETGFYITYSQPAKKT